MQLTILVLFKCKLSPKETNKSSFFIARCYMRRIKNGRRNRSCFVNCESYYNSPVNFSCKIISHAHYRKSYYRNNNWNHIRKMILLDIGAKILLRKALYRRSYVAHGFSFEIFLFSPRTLLSVCQTLLK